MKRISEKFIAKCSLEPFNDDEIEILEEYGSYMENLVLYKIEAQTDEEIHFMKVFLTNNANNARTEYEKIWIKYIQRCKIHLSDTDYYNQTIDDTWCSRKALKEAYKWK